MAIFGPSQEYTEWRKQFLQFIPKQMDLADGVKRLPISELYKIYTTCLPLFVKERMIGGNEFHYIMGLINGEFMRRKLWNRTTNLPQDI